jgi:ribonucleotide reductase alpha subunit
MACMLGCECRSHNHHTNDARGHLASCYVHHVPVLSMQDASAAVSDAPLQAALGTGLVSFVQMTTGLPSVKADDV